MSKVTIDEIAKRADVSIATVSRIINHKDTVKPETRQRVLAVMKKLNFQPKSAPVITDATSKVLLMIVPDFKNPFNSLVIDGVQKAARIHGYDVLLLQSQDFYTESSDYINIIKSNSIAGLLILSSVPNNELLKELSFRCPVVMCSEYAEDYGVSYVSINDFEAAKKAVCYMAATGCKKIGMINSILQYKYARHREKGYKSALEECSLEIDPAWISHISAINFNLAYSNAKHMLSLSNHPDGLFTSSDVYAAAAIRAAKDLGLRVPEDVSVIGFDNIDLSIISDPKITTVEQPSYDIGYQACELLVEKIDNPSMPEKQIILNTELIVRESTNI